MKNKSARKLTSLEQMNFTNQLMDEVIIMDRNKGQGALANTEIICDQMKDIRDDLVFVSKVLGALKKKARQYYKENYKTDKGTEENIIEVESEESKKEEITEEKGTEIVAENKASSENNN